MAFGLIRGFRLAIICSYNVRDSDFIACDLRII